MIKQDLLHIFKRLDNLKMDNNADNSRPRQHFLRPYGNRNQNRVISQKTQNARSYAKLSNATIRMLVEREELLQENDRHDGYAQMLQRENRKMKTENNWLKEKSSRMEEMVVKTMVEQDMNCPCQWEDDGKECKQDAFCRDLQGVMVGKKVVKQLETQREINNELMVENAEVLRRAGIEEGEIEE